MGTEVSSSPKTLIDQTVIPGDVVLDLSTMTNQTIKLGSGLRQDNDAISAMRAGEFRYSKPNTYWVESSHKRVIKNKGFLQISQIGQNNLWKEDCLLQSIDTSYAFYIPRPEDYVLGIIVDSKADNFWVDIKGPQLGLLPKLAFEGVTNRNKPKFEVGTLLYARVVKTNKGTNPELSCTDASGKAADFGPLKDGFMFETSTGLSRMLLGPPTCPVLEALKKKFSFETAFGSNGRVWVNAAAPRTVIIVANALMNSETLSGIQQRIMVEKWLEKISD